jgi:tRNA (guanine-N7-)-methyltransferase
MILENIKQIKDIRQHLPQPSRPLELEIGCGKGKFLLAKSQKQMDTTFIGLDWSWKWMKVGVERAQKQQRENIHFYQGEAMDFLCNHITLESVKTLHLYFPDPWPKKKHNKRRIFKPAFIQRVFDILIPGGHLSVATDYLDYYTVMQDVLYRARSQWKSIRHSNTREKDPDCKTNYEIKYEIEGRRFSYLLLEKG